METNTTTALEIFEIGLKKSDIKSMANSAVESVMEKGNVLVVAEALSVMETFIKEVKADDRFKEYTREETSKYPKGYVSPSGAKIECAETGTKYDYSQCHDPELFSLTTEMEFLKIKIEERQKFLKTVPIQGMKFVDEDGEVFMLYPPSKTSTSSYKVTLSR